MPLSSCSRIVTLVAVFIVSMGSNASAQVLQNPTGRRPHVTESGSHDGRSSKAYVAFREVLRFPGATSVRIHFGECKLGQKSHLTISSLEDGSQQRLDAKALAQWSGSSAYFNGDAVELALHVAPKDKGVFVRTEAVSLGGDLGGCLTPSGICGPDDRTSSNDPRVARFPGADAPPGGGCTTWIISNGAMLTAGHCSPGGIIEFNVPASDPDGTLNHPPADDQYAVDGGSVVLINNAFNDWAVYECFPNPNTGLKPVQAQGDFFRVSRDSSPATIRCTGYGYDDSPIGSQNWNSTHKTQQTSTGAYVGEDIVAANDVRIQFSVDVTCANSGGPLIIEGTDLTLGVVKSAGCENEDIGFNIGTGFENDDFDNAVQTFPGPVVSYADVGHAIVTEDGTVFRPFDTVEEAVSDVSSGGIVSIVTGVYTAAAGNTFVAGEDGKAMVFEAPVGSATIGG